MYYMAFSLRLDPKTEAQIQRVAAATGKSKAAVVRDAVAHYVASRVEDVKPARTTLDRLRPYVGVISSGGAQLSTNTHEKFREALMKKHRGRTSR